MLLILLLNNANATLLWVSNDYFYYISLIQILTLFCVTFTCLNWGINVDIIMSVVAPWRRSTAFSWFMLASHLFGDGPGPYAVGAVPSNISPNKKASDIRCCQKVGLPGRHLQVTGRVFLLPSRIVGL